MFYAVKNGRVKGIYSDWESCKEQVQGYKDARFKKFKTREEATDFMNDVVVVSETNTQYVYCDGSCIHNGSPNAKAGIGIYFGDNDSRNVSQRIKGNTNNIAELTAMIQIYDIVKGVPLCIVSDSKYALHCVGSYGRRCEKIQWPDIPNKELVKQLYYTYKDTSFEFIHVYAHTNKNDMHSIGNKHADKLAYDSIN